MSNNEMIKKNLQRGIVPAVPVPFTKEGKIDEKSQDNYIAWMDKQPIAAVALWAHTGRGLHLTPEQRKSVFNAWRKGLSEEKLIMCGIGAENDEFINEKTYLERVISMGEEAKTLGANSILCYPPTYFRNLPDQDEKIINYHKEIARLGLPMVLFFLYEEAGGITYSKEVLRELFKIENVVGIKMATLDSVMTYQNVSNMILEEAPDISLITGEDRMFGYTISRGAKGALVGLGAVYTKLQHDMMQAYYDGDYQSFVKLMLEVDKLAECTFIQPMEGYIQKLLYILAKKGIISKDSTYDPYGPGLMDSEKRAIDKVIEELGDM